MVRQLNRKKGDLLSEFFNDFVSKKIEAGLQEARENLQVEEKSLEARINYMKAKLQEETDNYISVEKENAKKTKDMMNEVETVSKEAHASADLMVNNARKEENSSILLKKDLNKRIKDCDKKLARYTALTVALEEKEIALDKKMKDVRAAVLS